MKIIFDSEDECNKFMTHIALTPRCPGSFGIGLEDAGEPGCYNCVDCFKDSINYEIKSENEETVEMTENTKYTYVDAVYELVKDKCAGMDSIYEDYIIKLVGECGLAALKRAGWIESCGVVNFRKLYVLCEKPN